MSIRGSFIRGQAMAIGIVLLAVASCGGSTGGAAKAAVCVGDAPAELGSGALCADSGFRLSTNDFSFANWGGFDGTTDGIDVGVMVRLYGAEAVCITGTTENDCTLNPAAEEVLQEWQNAITGGRCEGMATLAMRYFLEMENPADFQTGVAKAVSLVRPSLSIDQEINTWWATQFMPEVRAAAAESRDKDPVALVNELVNGLKNNLGYTIGLYGDGFGHAVTPFAVTKNGSVFSIHVYDNNYPGKHVVVTVDEKTKQWTYAGAAINAAGDTATWTGGTGSFELTPMAVRNGPFTDEFGAAEDESKGMSTISLEVNALNNEPAAALLITTESGKRFGVVNGELVREIPHAIYTVAKEEFGTSMVMVDLPAMTETYSVHAVSATTHTSDTPRDVIIEVAAPDGMRTEISAHRALHAGALPPIEKSELVYTPKKGVVLKAKTDSVVTVGNNRDKVVLRVPRNGTLAEAHTAITATDASGKASKKKLKNAAIRKARATVTTTTHTVAPLRTTTTVPRTSTTVKRPPTTTTTVKKPPTTTTTIRKPPSTTSTVVRSTTTLPRASSTTTTTTLPRTSTTVKRPTTTTSVP